MNHFIEVLTLIIALTLGVFLGLAIQLHRDIICDANTQVALHEKENIYPAWQYQCSQGATVTVLD